MLKRLKILTFVFLLSVCANAQQKNSEQGQEKAVIPGNTLITLQRTGCFGSCPSYKLSIYADGRVVYEGVQYVHKTGKIVSRISLSRLAQLVGEIEKADYFSLKDQYLDGTDGCPSTWTDSPSAFTSVRLGSREKKIAHYYGCEEKQTGGKMGGVYPKKFYELESKIDEIVNTGQWVGE